MLIDSQSRLRQVNEAYCRMSGYSERELLEMHVSELEAAESPSEAAEHIQRIVATGEDRFETRHRRKDGSTFEVEVSAQYKPEGGYHVVFLRDVTARKLAETELVASQKLIEGIINAIPVRVFWKDKNLHFLGCNSSFAHDAGFDDPKLILGKSDYQMGWRDQAELYRNDDRQVIESGIGKLLIEEPQTSPSGAVITLLTSKMPLRNATGEIIGVLGMYLDITERKQAETAIRESEERNRKLIEASADGILVRSMGIINYANPAAVRLFRAGSEKDLIGKAYIDLVHPDDRAESAERIRKNIEEGWIAPPREHRILTLDGQVVEVESTGVPVRHKGEHQTFGIFREITERKKAYEEKEKLEAQLHQAQKMESLGVLAGGIAHDFNNILGVIIGSSEMLEISNAVDESSRNTLNNIINASTRAKDLVRQILAFSRHAKQEKILLNLKPVIRETFDFLKASIPASITLRQQADPKADTVIADPTQMQQILMNLCTNAVHAMEITGGILDVGLSNVTLGTEDVKSFPDLDTGGYVRLSVTDTGHGIAPGDMQKIFDPYFTTKELGKGTGLGLSVVHGIVKAHGGAIKVYSELGKGSSFQVFLPRAEGGTTSEIKAPQTLPKGQERILLVDDEPALADIEKQMLTWLGYAVEVRTSAIEALEAFRANPGKFDLVLTDLSMPQMTGMKLAKEMIRVRSDIPIILCTGFSDQIEEKQAVSIGIKSFLFKPLVAKELAEAVRKVLGI
jgi:PAS domain S-box-containing protein